MKVLRQWLVSTLAQNKCIIFSFILLIIPASAHSFDNNNLKVQISSKNIFQGDVALLRVSTSENIRSVRCTWGNQTIDFYHEKNEDAFIGFLGIDLGEPPGQKTLQIVTHNSKDLKSTRKIAFKVIKKDFLTQYLTLPESQVTLSKKDLERHEREKAIRKKVFENAPREKIWDRSFMRPHQGKISTPFGVHRILNNKQRNPHSGVDFKAPHGAPVVSSSNGIVAYTGDHFFSGNSVFIDHGMGIFTMYFRLSSILVKSGYKVHKGQTIGHVGSTGRATGPHLHWGMRINNQKVDPFSFLKLFVDKD